MDRTRVCNMELRQNFCVSKTVLSRTVVFFLLAVPKRFFYIRFCSCFGVFVIFRCLGNAVLRDSAISSLSQFVYYSS